MASRLTGIPFGITVHAVDIYVGRFLCRKLRDAALLVTVCNYNVRQLQERCPDLDTGRLVIKYAGVDAERFRLAAPRPLRPGREILAVGRLTEKKGFPILVRAVALLREQGHGVHCRIVGDGGGRRELEALIAELGLQSVVELVGRCMPDELVRLLAEVDVLAAPSTIAPWGDRDSMPVVVKEAMAMELPVVATDDFGFPELVTPEAGLLVPRDDAVALAAALAKVLELDPAQRAAMGRAGRAIVEERFRERDGARLLAARFALLSDEAV